jgi:hypothetical protein
VQATFGDVEVITQQLPARRAFALSWKLGGLIPYVLARLDDKVFAPGAEAKALLPALLELFGRLSVEEASKLSLEILCCTSVLVRDTPDGPQRKVDLMNGEKIDEAFTGRIAEMYQTIGFVIGANFRDFIDGAASVLGPAAAAPEETKPAEGAVA